MVRRQDQLTTPDGAHAARGPDDRRGGDPGRGSSRCWCWRRWLSRCGSRSAVTPMSIPRASSTLTCPPSMPMSRRRTWTSRVVTCPRSTSRVVTCPRSTSRVVTPRPRCPAPRPPAIPTSFPATSPASRHLAGRLALLVEEARVDGAFPQVLFAGWSACPAPGGGRAHLAPVTRSAQSASGPPRRATSTCATWPARSPSRPRFRRVPAPEAATRPAQVPIRDRVVAATSREGLQRGIRGAPSCTDLGDRVEGRRKTAMVRLPLRPSDRPARTDHRQEAT